MKTRLVNFVAVGFVTLMACNQQDLSSSNDASLTSLAQTSGQLASGTSFVITGSATNSQASASVQAGPGGRQRGGKGGCKNELLDGTSFIATTDELAAIVDAESAGDIRGLRMFGRSGATVTHYDAAGNKVVLPVPDQNGGGPEGASFSGKQFPAMDSLLAKIVKTVVDFGTGVTVTRGDNSITREGVITILRSGSANNKTESISYQNYKVNGILIEGTKTRVSTFDSATGIGSSSTNVSNGKITLADGTVASWTSSRQRTSAIVLGATGKPTSGEIKTEANSAVKLADGTVVYSNTTTSPVKEDLSCDRERRSPVSGTVSTTYRTDTVVLDFGDGSCSNRTLSVTINGVTTVKTLGR